MFLKVGEGNSMAGWEWNCILEGLFIPKDRCNNASSYMTSRGKFGSKNA